MVARVAVLRVYRIFFLPEELLEDEESNVRRDYLQERAAGLGFGVRDLIEDRGTRVELRIVGKRGRALNLLMLLDVDVWLVASLRFARLQADTTGRMWEVRGYSAHDDVFHN